MVRQKQNVYDTGFSVYIIIANWWCLFLLDLTDATRKVEEGSAEEVKGKEPIKEQVHRMCLLRVKLMHFVNSLHNYIMTRVSRIGEQKT